MLVAETIYITTKCSGGCPHCPFNHPQMEKWHLELNAIKDLFDKLHSPLVVLSGGEFFEYDQIEPLLQYLAIVQKKYRIATGGHIDLSPYIALLKQLSIVGSFEGVSLGTDMILRQNNFNKKETWIKNLNLLNQNQLPYSLTFTILDQDDLDIKEKFNILAQENIRPQFIYLRHSKNANADVIHGIKTLFPEQSIITDLID